MSRTGLTVAAVLVGSAVLVQTPTDPFPAPIPEVDGVIRVSFVEFASIPDIGGEAARLMLLVDEPGTARMFVNDMRGPLYTSSYDGRTVTQYLDINASNWEVRVQSSGRERGFQSFAIHPQFNQPGTPGFGRLYTWTDSSNTAPKPDFAPGGGGNTHATVLLEWTARNPVAATYDGGPPREMLRLEQPFANHNGGHISFNPLAMPGSPDFGLLYVGVADGGSAAAIRSISRRSSARRSARFCASTRSAATAPTASTASRPSTRLPTTATLLRSLRSTPTACATRSDLAGIPGTETCSSPTSDRTSWKNSALLRRAQIWAGTGGRAASGTSAARRWTSPASAAMPSSRILLPSMGRRIRCSKHSRR